MTVPVSWAEVAEKHFLIPFQRQELMGAFLICLLILSLLGYVLPSTEKH